MQYVFSGDDATITVPLIVDGEYVVPDLNSVFYTLRGNDGSVILGNQAVVTDANTTEVHIAIAGAHNTKGLTVENRFLILLFKVNNKQYRISKSYRVVDFIAMTASESDVRDLLGLHGGELPDSSIDLIGAYFSLKADLGGTVLDDALEAGDETAFAANNAIAIKAALEILPSARVRASQRERFDSSETWRFAEIDWDKIERELRDALALEISTITGEEFEPPVLFTLSTRTDPFTGA